MARLNFLIPLKVKSIRKQALCCRAPAVSDQLHDLHSHLMLTECVAFTCCFLLQMKAKAASATPEEPLDAVVAVRSQKLAESIRRADERDKKRNRERIRERHRDEKTKIKLEGRAKTGGYVLGAPVEEEELIDESDDEDAAAGAQSDATSAGKHT